MSSQTPKNGEYSDGNFWFQRKGSLVTIGITNALVDEVGVVHAIQFPEEGDDFNKGESIGTLSGNLGKTEIIIPAAGVIEEINSLAVGEPSVVSEDPFEEGWLVKLQIQDPSDLMEYGNSED